MVARVSTYEGSAERLDDLARGFEESADAVRELEGFRGAYLLVDRETGRAITVALWASGEAAEASAGRAQHLREEAASTAEHSITGVELFEVPVQIPAS
jgi:heme-degrading monooxygenase HmoA